MRPVFKRAAVCAFVGAALGAAPALAGSTEPSAEPTPVGGGPAAQADVMTLGPPTPAPLGYLRFCVRRPDQCGLDEPVAADASQQEDRAKRLVGQFYWTVFFQNADASRELTPRAGSRPAHVTYDEAQDSSDSPAPPPSGGTAGPTGTSADAAQPVAAKSAAAPSLTMTASNWALLNGVNARINHAIRYVSDEAMYGQKDYWTLPLEPGGTAAGDCKDYALEKRKALVAAGVAPADLSIAIVRTPWNDTHAVLLVMTDQGELVLDSLSSWVQPWRSVHYKWLERQAPGQQLAWVTIVNSSAR